MLGTVLITGSGGQLGAELVHEFNRRGYEVAAFTRSELDITNAQAVHDAITTHKPQVVINPAAYNQVDGAESQPALAFTINALAVQHLASACRQAGCRLVRYSTDYVFDGAKNAPYTEDDPTHPIGAYAVSKLAGELYARAYLDNALIVRCSGVFGIQGMHTPRGNFPELMLKLAANGKPIKVVDDHIASPTYAPLLAARTADLVGRDYAGTIHIGGGTPISWYDYAEIVFRLAGLKPDLQRTNATEYKTAARRPLYSALSNARMEALGLDPFPPVEVALELYMAQRESLVSK